MDDCEVSIMGKDWNYAKLSKNASAAGGPEKYISNLEKYGFQKGILTMIPVCVAGCVITYKKGTQVVDFIKDRLRLVTKEEADYAKQKLMNMESRIVLKCPICKKEAYGVDEINLLFGFDKNENGDIVPNKNCKQCNSLEK